MNSQELSITEEKESLVDINSLEASFQGIEFGSVEREIRRALVDRVLFYTKEEKLNLQAATERAFDPHPDTSTEEELKEILQTPVDTISWWTISTIYERNPALAIQLWKEIKQEARNELESGHRAAGGLEVVDWQRDPWSRAQYLAIREGFVKEWQPKGTIELALIDMMAQSFSQYLYWNEIVQQRSTTDIMIMTESEREALKDPINKGKWRPPSVSQQEAIEHAMTMMERFNKLFLRTLRQLRDLRRYSMPVTINNPKQVNIATNDGKQLNIAE